MKRRLGFLLVAALSASVVLPTAVGAAGGEFQCNNQTLGPGDTIYGNLVVPSGAFCDLVGTHVTGNATVKSGLPEPALPTGLLAEGATIEGNVQVQHNAQFAAFAGTTVGGNVLCDKCEVADVQDSTVQGDLEDNALSEGAFIRNSSIGGNLQIHDGSDFFGTGFHIDGNTVGGNLQFNKNIGVSYVSGNTIAKNLQCKDNAPPPVVAGNAAKKSQGQCAA